MSIEDFFPKLTKFNYEKTSSETTLYNCVAWAMDDNSRWWEPATGTPGYYWPGGNAVWTVEGYANVFRMYLGFTDCENGAYEEGFVKIAIYGTPKEFNHVARLLPSGKWASKLGRDIDIEHDTLEVLEGLEYGSIMRFMKRPSSLA